MQSFLFGTMDEYLQSDYAPTNRATCKGCKLRIEKDSLRMGHMMQSDHFSSKLWHHLQCFKLKPLFKEIIPETQIYKLDQLEEKDRKEVIRHLEREKERLNGKSKGKSQSAKKSNEKAKGKSNKKIQKKKKEVEDEYQQETEEQKQEVKENRRTTRSKSRPKQVTKKRKASPSPSPSPKKSRPKKKAVASTQGSAKRLKKKNPQQGYTEQQKLKFKELRNKYIDMPTNKLKEILAANNQTKTGTKGDLAQKCADGELLGRIPMCHLCGGGKLRFMWRVGLYHCPGFMDDVEFKNCNRHIPMKEVVREPWTMP